MTSALLEAAEKARGQAHAPYSGFTVGAAVRAEDGSIHTGCNVEVSSYSHTCCAERVAVFKAVSEGHRRLTACAVMTDISPPASPCGACRQVLYDFGPDMVMILANPAGEVIEIPLAELLPQAFTPEQVLQKIKARHGGG
ncbi:MAG TPA: cytidine deaminase [Myxococcota bacterium]|nr:cytidine deaminase [Myxococcota bacterium]